MNIFKHRFFQQWSTTEGLTNDTLKTVIVELNNGLHDGNLGSGLYKKRIAMSGQGKRGSHRTLLAFKHDTCAFFIYGFSKNDIDNISQKEKIAYKALAKVLLNSDKKTLNNMIQLGTIIEIK